MLKTIMVIKAFDSFPICEKCGRFHFMKKPVTEYIENLDALKKSCLSCGYTWHEMPYLCRQLLHPIPDS